MKITDVTLTLFAWRGIPATTYGAHTGEFKGESQLGLLRIQTDEGVEGARLPRLLDASGRSGRGCRSSGT